MIDDTQQPQGRNDAHTEPTQVRSGGFFRRERQRGMAVILVVFFFITISLAIIQSATTGAIAGLRTYRTLATSKFAYVAAEAGIEDIFYRAITGKVVPASEEILLNGGTSTVTVANNSLTRKEVYAVGKTDTQVRKSYLEISNNKLVQFPYGAQVGEGGIIMNNNSTIDGTGLANGDVYSDGQIMGAPGVLVTGNAISSSGMFPDPIASSTVCAATETVGRNNPTIDYAESFVISATTSVPLAEVSLYINRNNNPNGASVHIVADNAGSPGTVALASQALPSALADEGSYKWVDVIFASPPMLDPAVTYWVVLDAGQDNAKYWRWCRSATDVFATGTAKYKTDWSVAGAWTGITGDLEFQLTLGGGVSKINQVEISGTAKADTLNDVDVGGDAYYQVISGSSVGGTSYPGSPTPPYVEMPISSTTIAEWKEDAAGGGTITGNCGPGGVVGCNTFPLTLGPKKIDGNLVIDGGEEFTVSGTIHVTGKIIISNNSTVKCDVGFLAKSCVIIVDGSVDINNNGILTGSGFAGSYLMVLSVVEDCLGESGAHCAPNFSGIQVANNVTGAIFYTTKSLIDIANGALVRAVVGYMLELSPNSTVEYDPAIANVTFASSASGNTGGWNVNHWNEH
jgi:hypothetical protein